MESLKLVDAETLKQLGIPTGPRLKILAKLKTLK